MSARSLIVLMLLILSFIPVSSATPAFASNSHLSPAEAAAFQLASLTPEERVGQLFLVTFRGSDTSPATPIFEFISRYHIGGVILDRDNDHFLDPEQIPEDCWSLIGELQTIEYNASASASGTSSGDSQSQYIPLFIGLSEEGNLSSYSELLTGLSPIPSQMSIGATWDPTIAEQIGYQVGRELSALGVNMLLGPSLDVVSDPAPGISDLGVRSFGGDPFWVGQFGQSYIKGVHAGSLNNIAVVAKYFPGLGSSDRLPEQEVATVRKSLDQLKQIDLAPFFAVTGLAPDPDQAADALLNSHIRYQGFQGNIRSTTRPISLDPQAFDLLMAQAPFSSWRDTGGIIISDNLGSQALQNLYDPTGQSYDIGRVAVDAFIAGNDILYLGNYGDENRPIPNHEVIDTIELFAQKYAEDQEFADRVDSSVLRILTLKNKIYAPFELSTVLTSENTFSTIGVDQNDELVARLSATLVNPELSEINSILQPSPSASDRLVILSDTESEQLCSSCQPLYTLDTTSLENAIIRLYGPNSGRQLSRANITSYSFRDLTTLLDYPGSSEQMVTDLYNADWIIVAALDQRPDRPYSYALTRLLSERQDLIRDKTILVFSLGAPYYLDATNISKISAVFALYNHLPSSLDVAARILFNEFPSFQGSLPVSVPGINYDLITATSPDPAVEFPIYIGQVPDDPGETTTPDSTPPAPVFRIGDQVDLFTGIILDQNGNPVPDGTPVTFVLSIQGVSTSLPQVTTISGTANSSFFVESNQDVTIHALSSAARSETLTISVLVDPDAAPTDEIPPTATVELPSPTSTSALEEISPDDQPTPPPARSEPWIDWMISTIAILAIAVGAYQVGSNSGIVLWGVRWFFACLISGFFAYNYLLLDLPGTGWLFPEGYTIWEMLLFVISASFIGWLLAYLYQWVFED